MTPQQFKAHWLSVFPNTHPVQYLFKNDYIERWLRIHSLPESKRYANTEEEWEILLYRQNTIITDLLGTDAKVLLVTGEYNFNEPEGDHVTETEPCFSSYVFQRRDDIVLNEIDKDENGPGDVYRPAFAEITWLAGAHDMVLKAIADDVLRAFFISFEQHRLVAPYDGGIDIILEDTATRDAYKNQYKDWLSRLDCGL